MAESDAEKEAEGKAAVAKGSPGQIKLVIVGAVALFVALAGAQVVAPLLTKAIEGDSHAVATSGEEETSAGEDEAAAEEGHEEEPLEPALYVALDPPFIVSFAGDDGPRYLQLTLQAMARDQHTIDTVKQHAPAIRNSFLFLLSGYELDELATLEGKEKLRAAMLAAANDIMAKNTGEPSIEDLYFTSLVVQ